jgi:hypothetical protein
MAGSLSDNPRGRQAVEVSTVFTGLALIIVALRLYTRVFIIRCVGIEDAGIALAMVSQLLLHIVYTYANIPPALLHRPDNHHRYPSVYSWLLFLANTDMLQRPSMVWADTSTPSQTTIWSSF